MKRINVLLCVVLAVLAIGIAYFMWGTDMKVDAAAARDGEYIRCDITLSNGSLFDYEYLEFILLGPDGAEMGEAELAGQTVGRMEQARTSIMFKPVDGDECRMEIGYYVLGRRKSVSVTVR